MLAPNHKTNIGANAKTGIDWLANKIGIIHLFNVSEIEIKIAKKLPKIIPNNKDKMISNNVIEEWFKISKKLLNKAIATSFGEGSIKEGKSNIKQMTCHIKIMTVNVMNVLNIIINSISN